MNAHGPVQSAAVCSPLNLSVQCRLSRPVQEVLWIKTIKLKLFFNLEIMLDKILDQIRVTCNANCCINCSSCVLRFFSCTSYQTYTKANEMTRDLDAV